MKKSSGRHADRFLALFLCAAVLLSAALNLGGRADAASQSGPRVAGCSLTVGEGKLGMNIFFSGITDSQAKNGRVTVDDASYNLSAKQSDGTYKVTHYVDPKDVVKQLPITLYSGNTKIALANSGAVGGTLLYSVQDYLANLKDRNSAVGRLAKAIDTYGICAYNYFKATKSGKLPVSVQDADFSAYAMSMSGQLPAYLTYYGSSLVLNDTISIRHYYKFTDFPGQTVIKVDGKNIAAEQVKEYEVGADYAMYYIEIPGILAWDIDHSYELSVSVDGKQSTLSYSVLTYAHDALSVNPDDTLGNLVKSIYWYNRAFLEARNSADPYSEYPEGEEVETDYITYEMFGAKGDGVTDDYDAIVLAHSKANEMDLPVKAKTGATYYIGHMDTSNPKGALVQTDTDWTGAEFIIDDSGMKVLSRTTKNANGETVTEYYIPDKDCVLFTIASKQKSERKWMNQQLWWYQKADGKWVFRSSTEQPQPTDIHIYLGMDPNMSDYPDYSLGSGRNYSAPKALAMINRSFSKETTKLEGDFKEDALYVLRSASFKRWGRNGSATATADLRDQTEAIIVRADGTIDSSTPLQWDWDEICDIKKYPIDKTTLTVRGGTFYTKVNTMNSHTYVLRGINVERSNTELIGVQHYLLGEDKMFTSNSAYIDDETKETKYVPRLGAPYQGFFHVHNCAYVTLKDCVFSNHLRIFSYGNNTNSTAPYDFYAEYCANVTLDGCTCAATPDDLTGPADPTGILDESRWGTTGTNFCKGLVVQNGCRINRIDAHMGTYNLTVKDSVLGYRGIAAVGFGTLYVENVTAYSTHFISLRRDFGSYWNGDIVIKNCTWRLAESNYSPRLIFTSYDAMYPYGYDPIVEGGKTYYCTMPTNVVIDGFVLDASKVTSTSFTATSGFQIFTNLLADTDSVITEAYLNNPDKYKYPLRIVKDVSLSNLKILMNEELIGNEFKGVSIKNPNESNNDEILFSKTQFHYDPTKTVFQQAEPWVYE